MSEDIIKVKKLIEEYKTSIKKCNGLNNTINDNVKKIKYQNESASLKGNYVELCNSYVKSTQESADLIESHLNKAIVQLEKCNQIINSLNNINKTNPLYATIVGLGTGLSITKGLKEIKEKKDTKEEVDEKKKIEVQNGRN